MDPYEVLGISYESSWRDIRNAYKSMLIKTHPDKMGNSKFFILVQDAYRNLKKQHEIDKLQRHLPNTDVKYNQNVNKINYPSNLTKKFDINKFNRMFEKYSKHKGNIDPFLNGGYNISESLNHQEDIESLTKNKIKINKNELVVFKEPEALSSTCIDNIYHLGINEVSDYTCNYGTDYMRAFREDAECIDNRPQYNSIHDIQHARSIQNMNISDHDRKKQLKLEKKRHKLEQLRLKNIQNQDTYIQDFYNTVNKMLK